MALCQNLPVLQALPFLEISEAKEIPQKVPHSDSSIFRSHNLQAGLKNPGCFSM
jgi:hypothetical protein